MFSTRCRDVLSLLLLSVVLLGVARVPVATRADVVDDIFDYFADLLDADYNGDDDSDRSSEANRNITVTCKNCTFTVHCVNCTRNDEAPTSLDINSTPAAAIQGPPSNVVASATTTTATTPTTTTTTIKPPTDTNSISTRPEDPTTTTETV